MIETIIEPIMEGLAPVLGLALLIGLIAMASFAAVAYILTVAIAFEYHWLIGCAVAVALFIIYVLIASFLVGLFLV